MVYRTRCANGLTGSFAYKKEFKGLRECLTVQFGDRDTLVTEVDGDVKISSGGISFSCELKL